MNNKKHNKGKSSNKQSEEKRDLRTRKRKVGDMGESVACTFLMKRGYKIMDRNYLRKYGEIDIVAKKEGIYHFVEVKTVSRDLSQRFMSNTNNKGILANNIVIHETYEENDKYRPEDNLHPWKLQRLARVIQTYILDKRLFDVDWQIDAITVYLDHVHKKVALEVLPNIVI